MALIAGMASIRVDGENYSTNGEFDIKIKNVALEPIVDADGDVHYSESKQTSTISGMLYLTPELDPQLIVDGADNVVQIELRNGKVALLRNAIFTGDASVASKDGTMNVEWQGIGKWS